jgi:hypothetical protein
MGTLSEIAYATTVEYFGKGIDGQGPYYDVRYVIDDWDQTDTFANALMGYEGQGTPHRHPLSPNLVCTEAVVGGLGTPILNAGGEPSYGAGGLITARYRCPAVSMGGGFFEPRDDPGYVHQIDPNTPLLWCSQELDFEDEIFTYPGGYLKWESDDRKINSPMTVTITNIVMTLTFHRLPYLPITKLKAARGKINSTRFLGADPFRVLFKGGKTQRDFDTAGRTTQKVQMVFIERPENWQKMLRDDKFVWDYVVDEDGGNRFGTYDHNLLIRF